MAKKNVPALSDKKTQQEVEMLAEKLVKQVLSEIEGKSDKAVKYWLSDAVVRSLEKHWRKFAREAL